MKNKAKSLLSNKALTGSFVMLVGNMMANAINYVYHLLMGRWLLSPEEYGTLGSLFAIFYILSIIPVSSNFAVVKFISASKSDEETYAIYSSVKKLMFKLGIWGGIGLLILSPFIASFMKIDSFILVALLAPVLFFNLINLIELSTLQGLLLFWQYTIPFLASSIMKLLIGVVLVYAGWNVFGAMVGVLLASIFTYWSANILVRKHLKITKKLKEFDINKLVNFAFPVLVQSFAFTALFTFDIILAKRFLSDYQAGLYVALSMLGKILFFVGQPITSVMFPMVSKKRAHGSTYRVTFFFTFLITLSASFTVLIVYALLPNLAIGLLYGEKYLAASSDLLYMGVFMLFYTASYFLVNFILSVDRTRIVIVPLIASIAQVIGIFIYHDSIRQILLVSVYTSLAMLVTLIAYLGYNEHRRHVRQK